MTRYGSADVAFLLVNGMSILGQTTKLSDERLAKTEETTVLGASWESHGYIGVKSYKLSQEGFYDDATNSSNAALVNVGGDRVLAFGVETNTIGKRFIGAFLTQTDYKRLLTRNAFHKANCDYMAQAGEDEGIILHALGAETGTSGDTTGASSQDNGVLSSNGGSGYLEVTDLTLGGWTSATLKILHSSDDISYTTLITFTNVTAAPTGERKTVTGTVNRHLAQSWLFNGAGGAKSINYMIGFARS